MRVLVTFIQTLKAPWAFGLVLMTTAVSMYITIHDGLEIPKAAYQFAAVLIGGYVSASLLAAGIGAMRTMFLMAACALLLIVTTIGFTPSGIFKDAAVEGLLTMTAGGMVVLIKECLARHKE